jgi:hypothetical protein
LKVDELERLVVALVLEEAAAVAQRDVVEEELELVEEVVAQQCTHQRGAAADGDVPAGLLLERGELLGDVALIRVEFCQWSLSKVVGPSAWACC